MTQHDDAVRLRHMLDAATRAATFTKGKQRVDLGRDEILSFALVRLLEIVGEAAKNVSPEYQDAHPTIPWRSLAATRNRLVHAYFDIDLDVVWSIISDSLPPLIGELEKRLPPDT